MAPPRTYPLLPGETPIEYRRRYARLTYAKNKESVLAAQRISRRNKKPSPESRAKKREYVRNSPLKEEWGKKKRKKYADSPKRRFKAYIDGGLTSARNTVKLSEEAVPPEYPHATPLEMRQRVIALRDVAVRKRLVDVRLAQRQRINQEFKDGVCSMNRAKEAAWYEVEKAAVVRQVLLEFEPMMYQVCLQLAECDDEVDLGKWDSLQVDPEEALSLDDITFLRAKTEIAGVWKGMNAEERAKELFTCIWPDDCEAVVLRGTSIEALIKARKISAYVGYTANRSRTGRKHERFAWLLDRKYPVLTYRNGEHFNIDEMRDVLGFQPFTLWANDGYPMGCGNYARCVEGHLLVLMHGYPLGVRLQKCISKGDYYGGKWALHEVFLTFSEVVPIHLEDDNCLFTVNGIGGAVVSHFD